MPAKRRSRLDLALVAAGLAPTREKAQALILAGRVQVDGQRKDKPGTAIDESAALELTPGPRPWASRGGGKLDGVLDPLGIEPDGKRCLDLGASTGGFTDVLLARGACHVTALDVGKGLIEQRLREDPRVLVVEELNVRYLRPEDVSPPYQIATFDLSFISLKLALEPVLPLLPEGELLAMVKPQFEVGRREVGPKGVVRDPKLRSSAVLGISHFLIERGWGILGVRLSPVAGPKGNREFFVHAAPGEGVALPELEQMVAQEVESAEG